MRILSPPPSQVTEFNGIWMSWINLFYETFARTHLIGSETVTAAATADKKSIIYVDATSAAVTITLPKVAKNESLTYYIKKIDSSVNAVTIDGNGSETIDGATTQSLPNQYDSIIVNCTGSQWFKIG